MDEETIHVSSPEELMKVVTDLENKGKTIEFNEKPESPGPKKRKKYSPRGGATCPKCGGNLRTVFSSLNEGGYRASKTTQICPPCDKAYEIHAVPVPVIEKKE
jgi:hypothetical protein